MKIISVSFQKFIEVLWDYSANDHLGIYPESITKNSDDIVWWKCGHGLNHSYLERTNVVCKNLYLNKCRICASKKISPNINSLAIKYPEALQAWCYEKNNLLMLHPLTVGSGNDKIAWWKCLNNPNHVYDLPNKSFCRGQRCTICRGFKVIPNINSILVTHPIIASEYEESNPIFVGNITYGSRNLVDWLCMKCGRKYPAVVKNRTSLRSGCPYCCEIGGHSRVELDLMSLLNISDKRLNIPWGKNHKIMTVDGLYEDQKIVIEYDGSYYHKGKGKRDIEKTIALILNGYKVIRIKEYTNYLPPTLLNKIDSPYLVEIPYKYPKPYTAKSLIPIMRNIQNQIRLWS